jgi:hypothetical protein
MQKSPSVDVVARERELGADEHHVHRQRAAAALDEELLAGAITSAAVLPGAYASRKAWKPSVLMRTLSRTDSSSASDLTARAMVELDVPRDEVRTRRSAA